MSLEVNRRSKRGRPKVAGLTERRCEEILPVAMKLFAQKGYSNTDLQDVAATLGVGKGTLYRYFPSKREMFQAAVDRVMIGMRLAVDDAAERETDPLAKLGSAIKAYLAYFDQHPEYVELLIQERAEFRDRKKPTYFQHREANVGRWRKMYRGLIRDGRVRDLPVEQITDAMSCLIYGAMFTNYFAGRSKTLARQADELLEVIFNGVLTPRESARREAQAREGLQ